MGTLKQLLTSSTLKLEFGVMGRRLKGKIFVSQDWRPAIRSPARHKEEEHGRPCLSWNPSKPTSLILLLPLTLQSHLRDMMIFTFNPTAGRGVERTEGEFQNSGANQSSRLIRVRFSYRHCLKKT